MYAWCTPDTLQSTRFVSPTGQPTLSFSLLVPARHEQHVLGHTINQMLKMRYPLFEIIIIVGHDDPGTKEVALQAASQSCGRARVVVDTNTRKNKPKALNTALEYCSGDVIGVFDAEDQVHPRLLENVDYTFRETGADVVQGAVQLINFDSNWYSLHNCLEYFFWFRSRLHLHAKKGFIPLGGNTVFVRTGVLREAGGWDQDCLAEDCELGVRLSSAGKKVAVAYDPELVTREETPDSIVSLLKQRTRWNQGFLQVHRKKEWRQLPNLRQRMLARHTLTSPFLQAFSGAVIPVNATLAIYAEVPVGIALLTFLPMGAAFVTMAFKIAGLYDFGKQYSLKIRFVHYLKLIIGHFIYDLLLTVAAIRAVWRERQGKTNWELTKHVGAHLTGEDVRIELS
ncbi:glycosyltransferase [Streptomyces sp. NPDC048362]|uniref:glycosyltransferase n=1 Tax=Streptomyces sp. NPDC048362 TaxID=3365539 RepID=UPI003716412D